MRKERPFLAVALALSLAANGFPAPSDSRPKRPRRVAATSPRIARPESARTFKRPSLADLKKKGKIESLPHPSRPTRAVTLLV
jgi:hypothetical protein